MNTSSLLAASPKAIALACFPAALALSLVAAGAESSRGGPDLDGTVHVPAFLLPESSLLDDAARAALKLGRDEQEALESFAQNCPKTEGADRARMHEIRLCQAEAFYKLPFYQRLRAKYPATLTPQTIGGTYTEVFTPTDGIAEKNSGRVLINLHLGAFRGGSRIGSHVESVPITSLGKIKVVSVDYRLGPEYQFPAASEDVEVVYRELLKTYKPENIGIYGCSAGGLLTAEVVAWLQWKGLPPPGAVGMFCGAADWWWAGDSGRFTAATSRTLANDFVDSQTHPYFKGVDVNDTLAFPGRSAQILAQFPPSLLITSTRDIALSSVVNTHSRLVAYGVPAELHVWEGLGHAFFYNFDLPQAREAYSVIIQFFDRTLGIPTKHSGPAPTAALEAALESEIEEFAKGDQASPPSPCQVLFVGSSSIALWKTLAQDMAPLPVINRGFGGAHIEYVNRWFDTMVAPYHPRAVVFYAGENDVAAGKSVDRVVADFDEFMKKKRAALGKTPVYFISLKPSRLRAWQTSLQAQVNGVIQSHAKAQHDIHYIDVASQMLEHGRPRDLFVEDRLHMSAQGYAIWTKAVRDALVRHTKAELKSCTRNDHHQ